MLWTSHCSCLLGCSTTLAVYITTHESGGVTVSGGKTLPVSVTRTVPIHKAVSVHTTQAYKQVLVQLYSFLTLELVGGD